MNEAVAQLTMQEMNSKISCMQVRKVSGEMEVKFVLLRISSQWSEAGECVVVDRSRNHHT